MIEDSTMFSSCMNLLGTKSAIDQPKDSSRTSCSSTVRFLSCFDWQYVVPPTKPSAPRHCRLAASTKDQSQGTLIVLVLISNPWLKRSFLKCIAAELQTDITRRFKFESSPLIMSNDSRWSDGEKLKAICCSKDSYGSGNCFGSSGSIPHCHSE